MGAYPSHAFTGPLKKPWICPCSDEESDERVSTIRIKDQGSQPQCVQLELQGVPAYGIVHSGADITIIGGKLLRKMSAVVKLQKIPQAS